MLRRELLKESLLKQHSEGAVGRAAELADLIKLFEPKASKVNDFPV